jgi:hypothetical protein
MFMDNEQSAKFSWGIHFNKSYCKFHFIPAFVMM